MKRIEESVEDTNQLLSQSATEIEENLSQHPSVVTLTENQEQYVYICRAIAALCFVLTATYPRYQGEATVIRKKVDKAKAALKTKSDPGSLKALRDDARELHDGVTAHAQIVLVSRITHCSSAASSLYYCSKASSKQEELKRKKATPDSSPSSSPFWHPVRKWDPALIDAINALGPSSATLVKK